MSNKVGKQFYILICICKPQHCPPGKTWQLFDSIPLNNPEAMLEDCYSKYPDQYTWSDCQGCSTSPSARCHNPKHQGNQGEVDIRPEFVLGNQMH